MKTIISFSGGKDSLAALLYVRNNITKKFTVVFCDTGWEAPETLQYIQDIKKQLDLNLVVLKSKKYDGFLDLAIQKKRFPSSQSRFCTEELKIKPIIDYILEQKDNLLIIDGIRATESPARALMQSQCTFFKYYFSPILGANGRSKTDKKGKHKFFTYRKKDVEKFTNKYADDVLRPIFHWSGQDSIDYIKQNGLEPNPLYKKGFKRVGCFPCINHTHKDIKSMMKFYPKRVEYLKKIEKETRHTLFTTNYIPKWACSNRQYPTICDIEKYLNQKNAIPELFPEFENQSCMSFYNLCE